MRKRPMDHVAVLEALYSPEPDVTRWAAAINETAEPFFESALDMSVAVTTYEDNQRNPRIVLAVASGDRLGATIESMQQQIEHLPPVAFRAFYLPPAPFTSHTALEATLPPELVANLRAARKAIGAADAVGVFAHPVPGMSCVLSATTTVTRAISRAEARRFQLLAAHLDCGFRLRLAPEETVEAVLKPDGRLVHLEHAEQIAPVLPALAAKVRSMEHARLRNQRREPDAVAMWAALVDGRFNLVPREDSDGRRHYLLVNNPPVAQVHSRFTPREAEIVRFAARGFTGKATAYALGLSPAAISETLGGAATKLGLRSRTELVHVAAALFGETTDSVRLEALSAAERQVLDLLSRGLSNPEIARLRNRSERTVANQVASLLRKTGRPGRRALTAASLRAQSPKK